MDSIYKILESLNKVSEAVSRQIKVSSIKWDADDDEDVKDLPTSVTIDVDIPADADEDQVEELVADALTDKYGFTHDGFEMQFGESVEEAMGDITPIDHSDDEDGASAEDIASAITRRMMAHPKFGALVREIDIIDLNDAIEDVAQFHQGGDLGTSDVSNMVRDVLKQLKKEGALSEEEDLAEMIGYYTIMLNGKVVARGVRATSEKDAIEQAYMKMGSASKYTGAGRDSFKAVREEQEVNEEEVEENAFNQAAAAAARAGKKEFEFGGKTHPVKMDKATAHKLDDDINEDEDSEPASPDEGGMAGDQAEFIKYAVDEIKAHIEAGGDFPEWFQNKMSDVYGKMKDLHGYMEGDKRNDADDESEEEVEFELEERKLSSSEEQEMERIVTAMKDDPETVKDMKERYGKRWKEVAYATATKMAKQHGKGTGNKKKKTESTTSGSVAASTGATGEGIYGNPSIYEGFNSRVENMITESMSVNVSSSTEGEPTVTVSATGEDANMLAQLLKLAAVPARTAPCEVCGDMHEGSCMREENEANSADNTQTYDMQYLLNAISGGLNGPKRQINPNNPGDNPLAMTGLGKNTLNLEESDSVESHLKKLYREFKGK